ncbi:hypothetical protein Plhal304r1_c003g0009361 [Plasmopara halstedii]
MSFAPITADSYLGGRYLLCATKVMVKLRLLTRFSGFSGQLQAGSLLEVGESELALGNLSALRLTALKQAPTPTNSAELHRMWIFRPHAVESMHLAVVLDAVNIKSQLLNRKDARQARLLQDFRLISNAGFRCTCKAYDTASKPSLLKLNAHKSRLHASRYCIDQVRLSHEVTDRIIFDWFTEHSAPPTCVLSTFVRKDHPSRKRTVYFAQDQAPTTSVTSQDNPLRETTFPSPDDGMEEANRLAANPTLTPTLDQNPSFEGSNTSYSSRFVSSLRKFIRQLPPDTALDDITTQTTPRLLAHVSLPPPSMTSLCRTGLTVNDSDDDPPHQSVTPLHI